MKRSFLELYALAVCFFIFLAACGTAYDVTGSLLPALWPSLYMRVEKGTFEKYESNEKYIAGMYLERATELSALPDEELTKIRIDKMQKELSDDVYHARYRVVRTLLAIIVMAIIWFVHWRLAKKARLASESAAT